MSFCFAFVANDSSKTTCALRPYRDMLAVDQAPHGWGLGYYQSDQLLVRKHPQAHRGPLDLVAQADNLKTNMLVGHVRRATIGSQRTENTHPFRFRGWTFCGCGTVANFQEIREELLAAIPEFIQRGIRGNTDVEHLFHLFLSFVNDAGRLESGHPEPAAVTRALKATFSFVDRLARDRDGTPSDGCFLVSNGQFVFGIRRGIPLRVVRHTEHSCPDASGRDAPVAGLLSAVLLGGDLPLRPGWEDVPESSIVVVDTKANIEIF